MYKKAASSVVMMVYGLVVLLQEGLKLPIVSEADMRALPPHGSMLITGHMLTSTPLPYYPTLPGMYIHMCVYTGHTHPSILK